jgi:hypothetical protein
MQHEGPWVKLQLDVYRYDEIRESYFAESRDRNNPLVQNALLSAAISFITLTVACKSGKFITITAA